jgi:hypothetical protein
MLRGDDFTRGLIEGVQALRAGKVLQVVIQLHPLQPREHSEHYINQILKRLAVLYGSMQGGDLAVVAESWGFEETDYQFQLPPAPYQVRLALTPMERYPREREGA